MNATSNESNKQSKFLAILFASLFGLAAVGAIYLFTKNSQLKDLNAKNELAYTDLDGLKQSLETELDEIETNFTDKIAENDSLSADLQTRVGEIEKLEWRLKDARNKLSTSEKENVEIKTKLAQLDNMKNSLEADIAALASTNQELRTVNEKIQNDLQTSNEYAVSLNEHLVEMSEKNEKLIKRLYTVAPAGFVAENFTVNTRKRNDKLTAKAKRTDEVVVSFDLNNVPAEYHEDEELYLVVTQFDGRPLENIPSKTMDVRANELMKVKAADIEKLTLKERQNIKMSFDADKDLEAGTYNLLVYADHGFLGATSFQLR